MNAAEQRRVWTDIGLASALLAASALIGSPLGKFDTVLDPVKTGKIEAAMAIWWLAAIAAAAAIALRRIAPVTMLGISVAATGVHMMLGAPVTLMDLCAAAVLYSVADLRRRLVSLVALGIVLVLTVGGWSAQQSSMERTVKEAAAPQPPDAKPILVITPAVTIVDETGLQSLLASLLVAAWATGAGVRSRRAYLEGLRARADDLERSQEQQAKLAVAAERDRISRELHDVVAHGLSVMVVQAQGGAAALNHRPEDTRAALAAIVETGRASLADMRRVLFTVSPDADWHPAPGLAALPRLVGQLQKAGVAVEFSESGEPGVVPAAVGLAVYRIVQEALTNTVKHAGPDATARVELIYQPNGVTVICADDGRAAGPIGSGAGLRGMRERARLLGGRLSAGPAETGFRVTAWLPRQGRSS